MDLPFFLKPPQYKGRWHGIAVTEGLWKKDNPSVFAYAKPAPFTQGSLSLLTPFMQEGLPPCFPLHKGAFLFCHPLHWGASPFLPPLWCISAGDVGVVARHSRDGGVVFTKNKKALSDLFKFF